MSDDVSSDDRKAADIYRDMVRDLIAENERMRNRITEMEGRYVTDDDIPTSLAEAQAEIRRLRVRIMEYEARAAVSMGTLEQPTDDEPAGYTRNVKPNAPPHDEP